MLILLVLLLPPAVPWPAVAAETDTGQPADEVSPDRRVCRRVQVTGSRVKERVCRTQRGWDRLEEESNETVDRARERGNVASGEG
jgi:hypothetical protein